MNYDSSQLAVLVAVEGCESSPTLPMVPVESGRVGPRPSTRDLTVTSRPSRLTGHVNQSTGGYELVLSAVVFGLIGWWLDRKLGWTPYLLVSFTILGFVGSTVSIYYRYQAQIEKLQAETKAMREATR